MGLFKKIKSQIKRSAKRIGQQVKRSTAVAAPVLLGPALGEKVGILTAKSAGQTARKSTLSNMARVSRVSGTVVQAAGTIVAGVFTAGIAAPVVYKVTGAAKDLGKFEIRKEQYKEGFGANPGTFNWRKEGVSVGVGALSTLGALGGAVGGAVGAQIGSMAGNLGSQALVSQFGQPVSQGAAGNSGAAGAAGSSGMNPLVIAAVVGLVLWSAA